MTAFLLLVLILLGVLLVRRTARLEERLGDLEVSLRRPAETPAPDLEEALAAPLRRLEAAAGDLRSVAESLRDLREAAPAAPAAAEEDPRSRILSWLRGQGLEEVLLLDTVDGLVGGGGELRFEARRGPVRVVGRVRLEGGRPVAWEGRDSYASFP